MRFQYSFSVDWWAPGPWLTWEWTVFVTIISDLSSLWTGTCPRVTRTATDRAGDCNCRHSAPSNPRFHLLREDECVILEYHRRLATQLLNLWRHCCSTASSTSWLAANIYPVPPFSIGVLYFRYLQFAYLFDTICLLGGPISHLHNTIRFKMLASSLPYFGNCFVLRFISRSYNVTLRH